MRRDQGGNCSATSWLCVPGASHPRLWAHRLLCGQELISHIVQFSPAPVQPPPPTPSPLLCGPISPRCVSSSTARSPSGRLFSRRLAVRGDLLWPHVGITWLCRDCSRLAHTRALGGQDGLCLPFAPLPGPARSPQVHQAQLGKDGVALSQLQLPSDRHSQTFIRHLLYALPVWVLGQQTEQAGPHTP